MARRQEDAGSQAFLAAGHAGTRARKGEEDCVSLPWLYRAWSEVARLLYPPRCEVCGRDWETAFCDDCLARVEWITAPYCARCNVPFPENQTERHLCSECRRSRSPLLAVRSVGLHARTLREAVLRLKFRNAQLLAPVLARLLFERVLQEADEPDSLPFGEVKALVPAVLHPRRRRWRGFDQAAVITYHLAELWEMPMIQAVTRVKFTRPQIELEPEQRRRNLAGAFKPVPGVSLDEKTVVVVDDVWTTGATLEACARACRLAGADRVYGLTVTRAVPSWHPAAVERLQIAGG